MRASLQLEILALRHQLTGRCQLNLLAKGHESSENESQPLFVSQLLTIHGTIRITSTQILNLDFITSR
jgi:hypothetical protein